MISTASVSASNRKGNTAFGYGNQHAIKKADIGIVVADATYAARSASEIILTEPDLSVTISAMLTSRAIFQRMENYMAKHIDDIVILPGDHLYRIDYMAFIQNHIVRNADITLSYVPVGDRWQLYLEMLVEHWRFADSMEGISNALVLSFDEMQRHPDSEKIIVTKKLHISVGNPIIHTIRRESNNSYYSKDFCRFHATQPNIFIFSTS